MKDQYQQLVFSEGLWAAGFSAVGEADNLIRS